MTVWGSGGSEEIVPDRDYPSRVLGWVKEGVQEADGFLKQQVGYNLVEVATRMILGQDRGDLRSSELSNIVDNEFGSIALQLAAALTDVKPFWEFKTANPLYERQAQILDKLSYHWWMTRQIDCTFMDAIKFSLVCGTGYLHTIWDPTIQDLVSYAEYPLDVLPIRPNPGGQSIQDCFAVIVRREKTVNELRMRWPNKASEIKATRDASAAGEEDQNTASKIVQALNKSPWTRYREFLSKAVANFAGGTIPVTDQYTCYVKDPSINGTGDTILMGPWSEDGKKALVNWAYEVPPGKKLYPRGRTIVATPLAMLYDGPSNYWHGGFPISKLTLDRWPFPKAWLGKSPLWDIIELQRSLNRAQRAIEDHTEKFVGPDLIIDQSTGLSQASIDKIDTRKSRGKFKRRPGPGEGFKLNYPEPLPAEIIARPGFLIERMRSLAGISGIDAVLRLQQLPEAETIEKLMEASTGPVRARSKELEAFMREFAMQRAFDFTQYYTVSQRIAIAGADGITIEDFDFDPGSLVPAYIGSDYDSSGHLRPDAHDFVRPRLDRANDFLRYITYHVTPGSLLKSAKIADQLMYLQLFRAGILDPITLMEKLEIPNIGEPAGVPKTIVARMQWAAQNGLMGQVSAAGRKSSGQKPPKQKSSGAISESG
jgi:hypothetical protein